MKKVCITTIENPEGGRSIFGEDSYSLDDFNGMGISDRQQALNFRHRLSEPGYSSDWHVAGDPTLIIIRQGVLRISLRDGSYRDFAAGDQFIARDYLATSIPFDASVHGHKAKVIGDVVLHAVHVKLDSVA